MLKTRRCRHDEPYGLVATAQTAGFLPALLWLIKEQNTENKRTSNTINIVCRTASDLLTRFITDQPPALSLYLTRTFFWPRRRFHVENSLKCFTVSSGQHFMFPHSSSYLCIPVRPVTSWIISHQTLIPDTHPTVLHHKHCSALFQLNTWWKTIGTFSKLVCELTLTQNPEEHSS